MKHNYLNNRDILKEIHKSKMTYCSFASPGDAHYDIILDSLSKINRNTIAEARRLRADRLARVNYEQAQAQTTDKLRLDDFSIDPKKIPDTEIVFRISTWEHVPIDNSKKKKAPDPSDEESIHTEYDLDDAVPTTAKYVKINFPPFKHYKITDKKIPYCVGISHWKGDIDKGSFCRDHGTMTPKLAHMFIKLCERYATRSNWRGYTYNDEMRSQALLQLSQIGLQFDESKSQNPFAYYTAAITNSFTRVLNIEKRNQNLRDDILEMNGLTPSYTRQGMGSWGGGSPSGDYNDD